MFVRYEHKTRLIALVKWDLGNVEQTSTSLEYIKNIANLKRIVNFVSPDTINI